MSEHLSSLQLDEIAAGLSSSDHLDDCAACSARLTKLKTQNAAFMAMPRAIDQQKTLMPAKRRTLLWLAPAMAAALALGIFVQRDDASDRIKGSASMVLLDVKGDAVTEATPGQKLTLAVGGAGAKSVKVIALDTDGKKDTIFSGPISTGARVPLMELEVTPGDVTLNAEFDDGATAQVHLRVK